MKVITVIETTCDAPDCSASVPGEPPAEWFTGWASMGGEVAERHICPTCAGDVIDPRDDIAAEIHRFDLERRVGA